MRRINLFKLGTMAFIALSMFSCKKETENKSGSPTALGNIMAKKPTVPVVRIFATGFNNPRGLKFGPDGYLYVAEAGIGGTQSTIGQCQQVIVPVGPYLGSPTGARISRISSAGVRTTFADNLPSSQASELIGGDVEGVSDVAFVDHKLYALLAGAGCSHGVSSMPNGVIRVNHDGSWSMVANISSWLMSHPVAHPNTSDFEPDGTPYSMINVHDILYVIEPNHGDFIRITKSGNISRVADISATQGHIVPTVVAHDDDAFYIGNLNTFPIVDGSSKILKVTPGGNVSIWETGFTTILGLVIDREDNVYVLQNTTGAPFPTPGKGSIVRINHHGDRETVVTGLSLPTGMTMGPDGNLYVSNIGFGPAAIGGGQVLQIDITRKEHDRSE